MANDASVNGHTCWSCNERSYADCASNGVLAYCQGEQMHCFVHERKSFHNVSQLRLLWLPVTDYIKVVEVEMGCKQDRACYKGFLQNDRTQQMGAVVIAGLNDLNYGVEKFGPYRQCFPEDANQPVSICRTCCNGNNCSNAWKTVPPATEAEWNNAAAIDDTIEKFYH